jgi:hypothetical protein
MFPRVFGSNYSTISQNRYVLPGARISLRFPDDRVYLPPERTQSVISMESVPVKLDTRAPSEHHQSFGPVVTTDVVVLTPITEAWSPTVSERAIARGATSWFNETEHETP